MSTEGAAEWRASHDARKNQLADEQRQAQEALLSNQVASGAINPAQYGQGVHDLYAHEPAESRLGRIGRGLERAVGLKKQANAQQQVADANLAAQPSPRRNLANIEAQAKTPQQLQQEQATARLQQFTQQGDIQNQQTERATQASRQAAIDLIKQYVPKDQQQTALEDYARKQAGILTASRNITGAAGQPFLDQATGRYVRPVQNPDGTVATQAMPEGWTPAAPTNPDQRYVTIQQKKASGQPLTPQETSYLTAYDKLQSIKVQQAGARGAAFNASRPLQVITNPDTGEVGYETAAQAERSGAASPQSIGFKTRAAVQAAFTHGAPAQNITSINTLRGHLSMLTQAANALQNGNTRIFNDMSQRWAAATGEAAPLNFDAMKNAVASELARTLTGRGATVSEVNTIEEMINRANSPQQFAGVLQEIDGQMQSRLDALQQQYRQGMSGQPAFNGSGAPPAPKGGQKPIVQHSASTNQYRYSTDGGRTWLPGQPPK